MSDGSSLQSSETAEDAVATEHRHGIEQRRSDGLADDGDACRVDQQASLDAFSFGQRAKGMVASIMTPFRGRNCGQGLRKLCQELRNLGVFPEFRFRGGIDFEIVGEKRARP